MHYGGYKALLFKGSSTSELFNCDYRSRSICLLLHKTEEWKCVLDLIVWQTNNKNNLGFSLNISNMYLAKFSSLTLTDFSRSLWTGVHTDCVFLQNTGSRLLETAFLTTCLFIWSISLIDARSAVVSVEAVFYSILTVFFEVVLVFDLFLLKW